MSYYLNYNKALVYSDNHLFTTVTSLIQSQ